jgi:hypothetical protein
MLSTQNPLVAFLLVILQYELSSRASEFVPPFVETNNKEGGWID